MNEDHIGFWPWSLTVIAFLVLMVCGLIKLPFIVAWYGFDKLRAALRGA